MEKREVDIKTNIKKWILSTILSTFLIISAQGEVIGVPGYNYSINPLEGWEIQPYENDGELAWVSSRDNVVLSVQAWSGDTFSDVTTMFNEISSGLSASGNCVKFDYLDLDGVIGEVSIDIEGKSHSGWIIFLNGDEYDYYLMAFTLTENYKGVYNEIQSALDSFSYGDQGELNPGPISAFLNQSPSRTFQNYTVDFFNNPLTLSLSDYDFTTAQSVIEREAEVMLNYSDDPENFYRAWQRYYQIIFRDNYIRLDPLFEALYPYFAGDKYTDYEVVELLMFWIQGYTYERTLERNSDLLNPLESSTKKLGDCDARSIILGILLHKFNIESLLLISEKVKHAIVAVDCPGDGYKYNFEGKEYLGVELTTKALVGEIKESITDPSLWTPVKMEYSNGY